MRYRHLIRFAPLALLFAITPQEAPAHYVHGPFAGTVTATTYYSSGKFHGAVDIARGGCGSASVRTALQQRKKWTVTIRTTSRVCYGNGSGRQNEARTGFSSGWTFRQWHFNRSSSSKTKTCFNCVIGTVGGTGNATGPHSHLQYDRYGTKSTRWYSVRRGQSTNNSRRIGYLP